MKQFAKKLGVAGVGQASTVLFGAACGFIVIHAMSKETYAQYSFLQSWMAFFAALNALSLLSTYNAMAGPVASDSQKLQTLTATAWRLNVPFMLVATALAAPALLIPTWHKGWYSADFVTGVILAVGAVFAMTVSRFHQSLLQIEGRVKTISGLQPAIELGRATTFFGCSLTGLGTFLSPFIGAALLSQLASNVYCARRSFGAWLRMKPSKEERRETGRRFWEIQRPLLFPAYFYQLQSFFMPAIVTWFAPTETIADVGALGRLMLLLAVLDRSLDIVFYPALARELNFRRFEKKLLVGLGGFVFFSIGLVISAVLFPGLWLWLLGSKYSTLEQVLAWSIFGACLERIGGMFMWAMIAKGMARHLTNITLGGFFTQIVFVALFFPDTVYLAVMFNLSRIVVITAAQMGSYLMIRRRMIEAIPAA